LIAIRTAVDYQPIAKNEIEIGKRLSAEALDLMSQRGIEMADGRFTANLVRVARGLSLLNNEKEVSEAQIRDALKYALTAKLAVAAGTGQAEVDAIVDNLG
jgi:hypothetical protein